ncbi:MAG TPA: neutral/alkaline non-lysosomal ceramidase N-terminal domain-containing protein, partial [Clostridia bacterium]|nr:neutral/alkaline non-lysosomal ceramidase N-terminal domain-containing protein [Clostridia bacterium]
VIMKKVFKSTLALVLCVCMLLSVGITGLAAVQDTTAPTAQSYTSIEDYMAQSNATADNAVTGTGKNATATNDEAETPAEKSLASKPVGKTTFGNILAKIVNFISDIVINKGVLGALRAVLPQSPAIPDYDGFDLDTYDNFYPGTETFLDEPAAGAQWHLGYAQRSIMPADFGTKTYVRGSLLPYARTKENFDELRVRTIILDDGSGRGKTVFSVIDCIGIANADVRKIRAAVADFAAANHIVSINVSATHTHSGLDSQGIWHDPAGVVLNNIFTSITGFGAIKSGVDDTVMQTMVDQTVASIKEACVNMEPGSMSFAKKDLSDYAWDRTPPLALDPYLYKLQFTPDAQNAQPTLIASFGCHPETTSFEFDTISADFIYYMEEVVNKAGFNFVFIQGNVSTTATGRHNSNDGLALDAHEATVRYGHELGYITLGLSLTQSECAALNLACGDLLGVNVFGNNPDYTVWYEDWVPVAQKTVVPLLNIRMDQFLLKSDNNVSNVLGKVSLANNFFVYDKKTRSYHTVTEIGYLEIGKELQVLLSPGEIMSELLVGGPGLLGFQYDSLRDMYGENIIIFDLVNDAIGYVAADPNYVMVGMQYNEENDSFVSDTWCLLISMGKRTGSTLIGQFIDLVDSVR